MQITTKGNESQQSEEEIETTDSAKKNLEIEIGKKLSRLDELTREINEHIIISDVCDKKRKEECLLYQEFRIEQLSKDLRISEKDRNRKEGYYNNYKEKATVFANVLFDKRQSQSAEWEKKYIRSRIQCFLFMLDVEILHLEKELAKTGSKAKTGSNEKLKEIIKESFDFYFFGDWSTVHEVSKKNYYETMLLWYKEIIAEQVSNRLDSFFKDRSSKKKEIEQEIWDVFSESLVSNSEIEKYARYELVDKNEDNFYTKVLNFLKNTDVKNKEIDCLNELKIFGEHLEYLVNWCLWNKTNKEFADQKLKNEFFDKTRVIYPNIREEYLLKEGCDLKTALIRLKEKHVVEWDKQFDNCFSKVKSLASFDSFEVVRLHVLLCHAFRVSEHVYLMHYLFNQDLFSGITENDKNIKDIEIELEPLLLNFFKLCLTENENSSKITRKDIVLCQSLIEEAKSLQKEKFKSELTEWLNKFLDDLRNVKKLIRQFNGDKNYNRKRPKFDLSKFELIRKPLGFKWASYRYDLEAKNFIVDTVDHERPTPLLSTSSEKKTQKSVDTTSSMATGSVSVTPYFYDSNLGDDDVFENAFIFPSSEDGNDLSFLTTPVTVVKIEEALFTVAEMKGEGVNKESMNNENGKQEPKVVLSAPLPKDPESGEDDNRQKLPSSNRDTIKNDGNVVNNALPPVSPDKNNKILNVILIATLGTFFLFSVLAFIACIFWDKIKSLWSSPQENEKKDLLVEDDDEIEEKNL